MKRIVVIDDVIRELKSYKMSQHARHPHTPLELSVGLLMNNDPNHGMIKHAEFQNEIPAIGEVVNILNEYGRDIDIRKLITFLMNDNKLSIADLRAIMFKCERELFERLS